MKTETLKLNDKEATFKKIILGIRNERFKSVIGFNDE